jgi:hypothetical protein
MEPLPAGHTLAHRHPQLAVARQALPGLRRGHADRAWIYLETGRQLSRARRAPTRGGFLAGGELRDEPKTHHPLTPLAQVQPKLLAVPSRRFEGGPIGITARACL